VSGIFYFIATSSPQTDNDGWTKKDIAVNALDIGYLEARSHDSSSGHAIVHMRIGDKACLKLNEVGYVGGEWTTSFSGMLVQPDL
jgi:hypothetical protein